MNYKQLVEAYLRFDFKLELFKTVMPTMVAVSLIYINNLKAPKRDYENRKNRFVNKLNHWWSREDLIKKRYTELLEIYKEASSEVEVTMEPLSSTLKRKILQKIQMNKDKMGAYLDYKVSCESYIKNKLSAFSMAVITLMLAFVSAFFKQEIGNQKYLVEILFAGIVIISGMLIDKNKKERKLEFILKIIDDETFIKHM